MGLRKVGSENTVDIMDQKRKKKLSEVLNDLEVTVQNISAKEVTIEELGGVPSERSINGKDLSEDVELTASDIQASDINHIHPIVTEENDGMISSEQLELLEKLVNGEFGGGVPVGNAYNMEFFPAPRRIYIKWSDPTDIMYEGQYLAKWNGTKLVRKAGSYPHSSTDGVLVVDNRERDLYSNSYFVDSELQDNTTYYYKFFPYTDKNVLTDSPENEMEVSTIIVPPGDVTDITAINAGNGKISIKWTDPDATIVDNGITMSIWAGTKVVYKTGSYPANENDGTIAKNVETINEHSSNALIITGLTNGSTYYIKLFPYNTDGIVNYDMGNETTVVPDRLEITAIPSQSGTITYDGNSKTPSWSNYDSSKMTLGGTTSGTNAGSYNATFTPKSDYKWSDGTTTAKTISWSIGRATITTIPSQSGTITYDGNSKTPSWSNYDSSKMTLGGTTTSTNAGSYNATFTPGNNYKWSDGTTTAKTVTWTISKTAGTLSISPTSITLNESNLTKTITVTRTGNGTITATSSNTSVATVSVSGTNVTVSHVNQKVGTATITVKVAAGTNHTAPADKTCAVTASFIPTVLNDATWAQIKSVSDSGKGSSYWSIGDRKAVTLNNSTVGLGSIAGTYYCSIIGFNHNSSKEGNNSIHFQFGFTALTGGTSIAFIDSKYGSSSSQAGFRINTSDSNSGGWNSSYMRKTICQAFKNVLPSDLQNVLKTVTKYSDNTGGGNIASYVTATTDTIFLPSEFEVHGTRTYANSAEQNYQLQYDYYKSGNLKVRYRSTSPDSSADWWVRSSYASNTTSFCCSGAGAAAASYYTSRSSGFAPCFVV